MKRAPDRILVAGVGNIFLGDDGFGVEVARRLAGRPLPTGVRVVDFGIRGMDLTYALLDGYEAVILVDATARGGSPGTLYVLEETLDPQPGFVETHGMTPQKVLALARELGGELPCLRVVGCEVGPLGAEEELTVGLSPAVDEAVEPAVAMVESLVKELLERAHA